MDVKNLIGRLRDLEGRMSDHGSDTVRQAADLLQRAVDEAPKLAAIRGQIEGGEFFPVEVSEEQRVRMAKRLLEGTPFQVVKVTVVQDNG